MDRVVKKEGIVLKTIPHREQAQIVYILTPDGLDSSIVRGASKPGSKTSILTGQFNYLFYQRTNTKTLNTITEGQVITSFPMIKQDYDKLQVAFGIVEKLSAFHEQVTDKDQLFKLAIRCFEILEKTEYPLICLSLFEVKLFYLLGIGPNFTSCIQCEKKISKGFFNVVSGGIVCETCHHQAGYDLNQDLTTLLKYLYLIKLEKVDDAFFTYFVNFYSVLNKIIDYYYEYHLGFKSNSKKVFMRAAQ